ncbi:hypothetical protein ED312_17405 [Sinomicrobium pectinilyticum]|uniref:Uncharacterized protein n=1 Tax=Sinomicrobium pectinilyticum TaxID=1084421 RepID=A0A3N0E381_SINP1|nr:DUF6095 family protein [Sinomicrobium pectinilyticum]RNL82253.1 hypothetical protein ED312_17405 [Sinomicrobium pectinilyticum]
MRRTDRQLFLKSLKYFAYTLMLMFGAPIILYQAFKNQEHPFYWPVLILGLLAAIGAIVMAFVSLRIMMKSFFGD